MSNLKKTTKKTVIQTLKKSSTIQKKKVALSKSANDISMLQRSVGNRAVQRLMNSGVIQAKLTIGQPNDKYEQEADSVADEVMRMPEPNIQTKPIGEQVTPLIQRQPKELLQTKSTGETPQVTSNLESKINALEGGGQALSRETRDFFEPRFGQDFSRVRVHNDSNAHHLARSINARAFTRGNNVVFGGGEYSSSSFNGKRLLGHEFTHVIQQNSLQKNLIRRKKLSPEEKALDLQSPQLSGDNDLQKAYDNNPAIKYGSKAREAVKKIQQALIDDSIIMPISTKKTGLLDGLFGNETYQKVSEFQRKYHITRSDGKKEADGIVGRNTLDKMDKLYIRSLTTTLKLETAVVKKSIGTSIVKDMENLNKSHQLDSTGQVIGVWYPHKYRARYKKYIKNKNYIKYPNRFPLGWKEKYNQGYANKEYFELESSNSYWDWRLKENKSASEGIKVWLKGLTIAECNSALVAIEINALRKVISDKKFDKNFGSAATPIVKNKRLRIKSGWKGTPIENYKKRITATGIKGKRDVGIGEWCYFSNHPKYLLKHPAGAFQGENAVYMDKNSDGEQLWSGFGILKVTEDKMLDEMVKAYNYERSPSDYRKLVLGFVPSVAKDLPYKEYKQHYLDNINN